MQEDLEVTGISRSGRVRKKSSKLMDFESPDDIETRFRRQTPVKSYTGGFRHEESQEFQAQESSAPTRQVEDAGTASGSESDYYENTGENADSMESDSSASDEGSTRTPANSLYMMEKSSKKKLIVKDGRVVGRAKAQRKDKGKTRITAYMMWAKEARNELLRKHPDMDFSAISKRLGEMWSNVNYNERYLWKRKAKRFAMQKEQSNQQANKIISNPKTLVPSKDQMEVFLEFLYDQSDLAQGKLRSVPQRIRAQRLWREITDILNSMDGCVKSVQQWQKVWADKKYLTRKALNEVRRRGPNECGGAYEPHKIDQKILRILKKISANQRALKIQDSSDSDEVEVPKKCRVFAVNLPVLRRVSTSQSRILDQRHEPVSLPVPRCDSSSPSRKPEIRHEPVSLPVRRCDSSSPSSKPEIHEPGRPLSAPGPGRPPARAPPKPQPAPPTPPQQQLVPVASSPASAAGMYRVTGCGAVEVAAHLRLLGESLAIIGERLKEHEGQIAVSGSVSVLLDTLLCSLAPLLSVSRAIPAIAPPQRLLQDTLHNIAYIMPGL